jgi:flagellar motor switch protein FliM
MVKDDNMTDPQSLCDTPPSLTDGETHTRKDNKSDKSGITALLKNKAVHYERLPMLEVVFDHLARLMTTSMRNFTSENVDVTLEEITSVHFGDYMDDLPSPVMLGVFKADPWDNYGLLIIDNHTIFSTVDVLLGGRRGKPLPIEGRLYTTIERSMIERMVRLALSDLEQAFLPVCNVTFTFGRLEINPRFAMVARASNAAIVLRLRYGIGESSGIVELLLPYATLEPVRDRLLQNFMGEKFGRDSIWERHLAEQLWGTEFTLELKLPELHKHLRDVLEWNVGTRLEFNCSIQDVMDVYCQEHTLLKGRMGQKNGLMAIQIENTAHETMKKGN